MGGEEDSSQRMVMRAVSRSSVRRTSPPARPCRYMPTGRGGDRYPRSSRSRLKYDTCAMENCRHSDLHNCLPARLYAELSSGRDLLHGRFCSKPVCFPIFIDLWSTLGKREASEKSRVGWHGTGPARLHANPPPTRRRWGTELWRFLFAPACGRAAQVRKIITTCQFGPEVEKHRVRARLDSEVGGGGALPALLAAGAERQARGVQHVGGQRGQPYAQLPHHCCAPRCSRPRLLEQRQLQHRAGVEYRRVHLRIPK